MTKRRKDGEKAVSIYEFDETQAFKECSVLHFNSANEPWLDFVSEKRSGIIQESLTTSFSPRCKWWCLYDIHALFGGRPYKGTDFRGAENQKAV